MGRGGPVKQPVRSRKLGLATLLALVVVVLTGTIAAQATTGKSQPGMCASIQRLGIEKQMNVHAAQILAACGRVPASSRSSSAQFSSLRLLNPSSPSVYGGPDVNEITGGEGNFPNVTQSETQTWAQGNTVVTTYNDSRSGAQLLLGRLVLDRQRSLVHEPELQAVLRGSRHRLRRPRRGLRPVAREVDRGLPRLRLRWSGQRCLDLARRRHVDCRPMRPQRFGRRP